MNPVNSPEHVRSLVVRTFLELGVEVRNELDLHETLLIDGGSLVARSYHAEPMMAMWLLGAGIVQFYGSEGAMLRTVELSEGRRPLRAAA